MKKKILRLWKDKGWTNFTQYVRSEWSHLSSLWVWASFIGIEMSPYSWDMFQSSHLAVCSGAICRMGTVCLSTECSSPQQLLNETIIDHIKTENTNDYRSKIIWSRKSESWKRLLEKLRKEHNLKICSLKIKKGKGET